MKARCSNTHRSWKGGGGGREMETQKGTYDGGPRGKEGGKEIQKLTGFMVAMYFSFIMASFSFMLR